MTNLLKIVQNTLKLGAFVSRGLYEKTGIDWVIEKLWFFACRQINKLYLKCLLNHLNPSSVEKIMVILLRLHRLDWSCAGLCSSPILGTLLCESYFVSWINILVDIMSFSYWGSTSYLEVGSESYGFSNVNHQTVIWVNTEIVIFGNIFRSFYVIMGIVRKLQSVVSSISLIMYLLELKN